jgi:hypothetical protein
MSYKTSFLGFSSKKTLSLKNLCENYNLIENNVNNKYKQE